MSSAKLSLPLAGLADLAVEDAVAEDFPHAPKKLSKKAASQMYFGGPPLSSREEAAAERDRPSERKRNTEVAIFSGMLTDRHSSASEKIKAATELGNLALEESNKEAIGEADGGLAALVKLVDKGPTAQAKERAAGALRNLAVASWSNSACGRASANSRHHHVMWRC